MLPMGLTAAQQAQLLALLYGNHNLDTVVRLMDTSHNYLDDLSDQFMDGNVVIDSDAPDADRALDITFLDPLRKIHLDPDSPHPSAMFIANMISVVYCISSPDGAVVFNIPVFCGPIDDVTRNGVFLNVVCLGKEKLSSDNAWVGRTWKKNYFKTSIIKQLLASTGEVKLGDIPNLPYKTGGVFAIKRDENPWAKSKRLASTMGMQLFYDGRGVPRLRYTPSKSVITIDERRITTMPQFGYDLKSAVNAVQVIGGKPKGAKNRINYRIVASDSHPLSPKRVGRNGVPRYLNPILIDDQNLKTNSDVRDMAERTLNSHLLASIDTTFDMFRNPLLEPMDIGYLAYEGFATNIALRRFTIPLRNSGDSSVGYLKRIKPRGKKPITRRKRK